MAPPTRSEVPMVQDPTSAPATPVQGPSLATNPEAFGLPSPNTTTMLGFTLIQIQVLKEIFAIRETPAKEPVVPNFREDNPKDPLHTTRFDQHLDHPPHYKCIRGTSSPFLILLRLKL